MKTGSYKSVFNLKEAATYLGISVPTLVRLLESLGTDHIFGKCRFCGDFIRDIHFIGIPAVGRISDAVCRVHGDRFVFGHKISSFLSLFGSAKCPMQSVQ